MFDVQPMELVILGTVALVVIPPKDLPKAMRVAGYWVGRMRGVAQQFRSGFDTMVREAELNEMEKKWAAENERIMREHPPTPAIATPEQPAIAHQAADDVAGEAGANDRHDSEDGAPIYVEHPVMTSAPAATPGEHDKAAS